MLVTKEPRRYRIECSNWPDFAAECSVELDIYHSSDCLHIHYYVDEPAVVANCGKDMEHVWEDSCVEFFFEPVHNGVYFNVECKCIGHIYLCSGTGRSERVPVSEAALDGIRRKSSFPPRPFGLRNYRTQWDLSLDIPASVFGLESYDGVVARGNFYKCADASPFRHYMSLFPIPTPRPDFHRPEYFGDIIFD